MELDIKWIDNQGSLRQCLDHLAQEKIWALDTEGDFDNHAYGRKLALIQILGASEPQKVYLIDPLSGIDLKDFQSLLVNQEIKKIMFAGDTDNRLFMELWGSPILGLWDIYFAAQVLGERDLSSSALCQKYTDFSPTQNKAHFQRTNWLKRPLSQDQIQYAAEDVVPLISLYEKLSPQFVKPAMIKTLENKNKKGQEARFNLHPRPWEKVGDYFTLLPQSASRLKIAYQLRDFLAWKEDKPAYKILSPTALFQWAQDETSLSALLPHCPGNLLDWGDRLIQDEIKAFDPLPKRYQTRKKR